MPPLAFSYTRFSSPEQARGDSLRRQVSGAEAWAAENGIQLDHRLTDAGLSAYHGRHRSKGAFGGFLAAVEAGDVPRGSILIVESLDRLSREDAQDAFDQLSALTRAGIEIVTLADGQRYSRASIKANPMQLMMSLVIMMRAHEESQRKSERIQAVWLRKKREMSASGRAIGAMVVHWCRKENDRYVLIPERAAIVRRVFEMSASGIGLNSIARVLNEEGVPVWGRAANGWQPSYIKRIVSNRAVMGLYQPRRYTRDGRILDGEEAAGVFPSVIPETLFYAVQAGLKEREINPGGGRGASKNILAGIAKCACGAPMQFVNKGRPPRGGTYLVCDSLKRGRGCSAQSGWWRFDRAMDLVLNHVANADLSSIAADESDAAATAWATAKGFEAALEKAERRRAALLAAFGDDTDATLVSEIRTATAEASRLREQHRAAAAVAEQAKAIAAPQGRAETIARLRERMGTGTDAERLAARSALAQELRRTLARLEFHATVINAFYAVPAGVSAGVGFAGLRHSPHTLGLVHPPEQTEQPTFAQRPRA